MKFLIAGLGSIGRRHLRNLLTLGERDIILFRTHKSTLNDEELIGFPEENNLDAALAHHPDAIIVSNPTSLHLDVAIPAAESGCHILLEKPVSYSMDCIADLQKALARGGGQLLVGYQFRFHPGLRMIARLLSDNVIGRPLSVRAHWGEYLPNWHPWENYSQSYSARSDLGGGVILTLSHPIDYLRWLFGSVQSVWAFSDHLSNLEIDVEDVAEIGITFTSGIIGSLHLDYVQQPPAHRLEIIGTGGTIQWDYADGGVQVYKDRTHQWEHFPINPNFNRNDMFIDEMRNFIAIVYGKGQPVCTLEDGVQALHIALAAIKSSKSGTLTHFQPSVRSNQIHLKSEPSTTNSINERKQ